LVHRDVKPSNVWLEAPAGRVKLLDFGLARPQAADSGLTNPGLVVGTPMYMAPEQAQGMSLDGRADLFSLGCVLYQMATGRPPFEGSTALVVIAAVITETPPPASQFNPALPTPLTDLLSRLLAKQPSARPGSAEVVVEQLQAVERAGTPPANRPATRVELVAPAGQVDSSAGLLLSGTQPQATPPSDQTPSPSASAPVHAHPAESSEVSTARRRAREAERRPVTVLVCGCDLFEAVLGREFSYELLAVATVDEPTLQAELAQLAQADILYSKGGPPRCAYTFKHALLEDALYNALVKVRRQQFHGRVGEVLEARLPQTAETQPEFTSAWRAAQPSRTSRTLRASWAAENGF
jgi:hypothetical protein